MHLVAMRYVAVGYTPMADNPLRRHLWAIAVVEMHPLPQQAGRGYRVHDVRMYDLEQDPDLLGEFETEWDHSETATTLVASHEDVYDLTIDRLAGRKAFVDCPNNERRRIFQWEAAASFAGQYVSIQEAAEIFGIPGPGLDASMPNLLARCFSAALLDAAAAESNPTYPHRHAFQNTLKSVRKYCRGTQKGACEHNGNMTYHDQLSLMFNLKAPPDLGP